MRMDAYDQPGLLRRSIRDEQHVIEAHQKVLDTLRARDGARASQAMAAHLQKLWAKE